MHSISSWHIANAAFLCIPVYYGRPFPSILAAHGAAAAEDMPHMQLQLLEQQP